MVRALDLADVLRAAGLTVVEVPGWRTRGAELAAIRGGVVHHTATSPNAKGDYPTLGVVRDGRPGIPGPLSQLGLGRSGTWYVVASGRANHAGEVHARYVGTHSNAYSLGVEAEHPGGGAPWPAAQYTAYVRGCATLARRYGIAWLGHKEVAAPAGRKSDPTFDMAAFRSALSVAPVSNAIDGSGLPNFSGVGGAPLTPVQEADDMFSDSDRGTLNTTYGLAKDAAERAQRAVELVTRVALGTVGLSDADYKIGTPAELIKGVVILNGLVAQVAERGPVTQEALTAAIKASAADIAAGIQVVIRDTDMERIRDAAVQANERTTGEIRDNGLIRFRPRLPGEA